MKTITYHRARIVDRRKIFKPKTSPIIQETGKHQRSLKLIDHTLFFEMRVHHILSNFFSTVWYEILVVQNHRLSSEWRKTCYWLSVAWKPGLVEMISIDHTKSCSGFTNVVTCSVILLFLSLTASHPSVCTDTFCLPLQIIWTVQIGVVILGVKLALQNLTHEKRFFYEKIRNSQKWKYLWSEHRNIVLVVRQKVKSIMPDTVPLLRKTNMCLTNVSLGDWQLF
jgi:hypothetical protein